MSATPRLVPDHQCKQRQCANITTRCWDVCMMRNHGWSVAPDTPVAPKQPADHAPRVEPGTPVLGDAPLPAAPAPTRATAEQEAEIDVAVKAGRITFEPGWDEPRPDTAPTEQAELRSIATNHDAMIILTQGYTREQKIMAVDAHMRRELTALADQQAPQPKLTLSLPDYEARRIVIASDEVIDGERIVCVAIEGEADSRDAARLYQASPRGIGLDWTPGCMCCGGEKALYNNTSFFVPSRETGEAIAGLFQHGARLDWRESEPNWIQVKIGACDAHLENLRNLVSAVRIGPQQGGKTCISAAIVAAAIAQEKAQ